MAVIKINGQPLQPNPSKVTPGIMDIDRDSERTASGLLLRNRVAVKRKLILTWEYVTREQAEAITRAVSPVFVEVEYDDLQEGRITGTFYAGDRTADSEEWKGGQMVAWKNLRFTLTER